MKCCILCCVLVAQSCSTNYGKIEQSHDLLILKNHPELNSYQFSSIRERQLILKP